MKKIIPEIKTPYQLGEKYVADHAPGLDLHIYENIDFESIGLNIQNAQNGSFTDDGYCYPAVLPSAKPPTAPDFIPVHDDRLETEA